jgi:hypothetical protein
VNDHELRRRVHDALAARDGRQPPPDFSASWRRVRRAAEAGRAARPAGTAWLRPAVAFAALGAIALAASWQFTRLHDGAPVATDAADLRLARELSPSRQWPTATDALLRRYDYAAPTYIEVPELDTGSKEFKL